MAQPHVTTTGATPPGAKPAFPPFQTETFASQLLWLAITFGLLYWLMSKVALPRIAEILEIRSDRIAADLEDAQRLKDESDAAAAAYEKSLADARAKAKAIAQETRDALLAESEQKRKMLEAQLAEKIAASESAISARTAEAMASVRGIAAEAATAIVERLTGKPPEPATVEAALNRALPN
jgi:F-type H+-transporting ATPase subunit b